MKSAASPARSYSPAGELLIGFATAIFPEETVFAVLVVVFFFAIT
jgi:hypothetical protein